jgi:hypothetical protein
MKVKTVAGWSRELDSIFKDDDGKMFRLHHSSVDGFVNEQSVVLESALGTCEKAIFYPCTFEKAYEINGTDFYQIK